MSNLQLALPGLLDGSAEWTWDDSHEVSDVKRFEHATVMRDEVVRVLAPRPGGLYNIANTDNVSAFFRIQRNFLY